jgi:hypothetical protein
MKNFLIFSLAFSCTCASHSQVNIKDSCIGTTLVSASYSFQVPAGDLAKRFGENSNTSLWVTRKTAKNFLFTLNGSFIFGNKIRENGILDSIKTSAGFIINSNGEPAIIRLYERGFYVTVSAGKVFSVFSPNPNSGIFVLAGGGFLQHKIRIEDIGNTAPQLTKDYKKGYDRLTNGGALFQFIGYQYLSSKRYLNFFAGFEFIEAWTHSRRSWDADLMKKDDASRIDLLSGIRAGWILPLYRRSPDAFYYN